MIKLIAVDIDGTLLNDQGQILPATIQAVKQATAAGKKVVLCTGRPLCGVTDYLKQLGLWQRADQYVISYNGSLIQTTNQVTLLSHQLQFNDYLDLLELAHQNKAAFSLLTPDCMYVEPEDVNGIILKEAATVSIKLQQQSAAKMETLSDLVPVKGMVLDEPAKLDQLEKVMPTEFKQRFTVLRSQIDHLEFTHPLASKEYALQQLAKRLGIKPAEVMAIGDEKNDLGMLKTAGMGIAMGNAVPELQALADQITTDNNHNGVGEAIAKWQ